MFENLLVVTVIIFVLWLGIYAVYLVTSRQHRSIEGRVEALAKKLEELE